jgi:hypothetical protein
MGIKARVYNQIRTKLYKKQLDKITDTEKIEFFNEVFGLNILAHRELNRYKAKRQYKAEIQKLREERKKNLENQK